MIHSFPPFALLVLGFFALPACVSPESAHQGADSAAYALVEERRLGLFGPTGEFRIDPPENSLRQQILRGEVASLPSLTLVDCLKISAENSRDYQSRKEQLYGVALDLTLEQWNYGFQFSFGADASRSGVDGSEEQNDTANVELGLSRLLGTGAQVVASVGRSLFRVVNDGEGWGMVRDASFSITQPLLGGAAKEVVREPLTQAERNLVYEVRSFERYRRSFALDIATRYYQLLETMDTVSNEETNFDGLVLLSDRNQALAEAGQLSDIEADQARQDLLESENRLLNLRESLQRQLDDFKLSLGLPVSLEVGLVKAGLAPLEGAQEPLLILEEEAAVDTALSRRLDYLNIGDALVDSERKARVAADALRLGLDLDASAVNSGNSSTSWSAGFSFDLPIDRVPERNAFRNSLISLESARRSATELADQIRADLRDDLRQLRNTRQSYEIQLSAVKLADQRVESTDLNLAAGRSNTRNVLEARRSLVAAKNAAMSSLIDHVLVRLSLYHQLELLEIDESGIQVDNGPLSLPPTGE